MATQSSAATSSTANNERIEAFSASVEHFGAWVESNREPGGGWRSDSSVSGYFSVIALANHLGRRDWAQLFLHFVEKTFVKDGALFQLPNRDSMMGYVPSWLAWEASAAGCFRLSNTLADYVLSFAGSKSGGVFASAAGRDSGRGDFCFDSTTMAALCFAATGRSAAAERVGDFLVRLLEEQPEPDKCFRTQWREPDGIVAEDAPSTTVLQWDQPKQHYYKTGLYVMATLHAYGATGRQRYLDAALTVYRRTVELAVDLWTNTFSHKMIWAAASLHALTGERHYIEDACRGADHILSLQEPDGTFQYPEACPDFPPELWEFLPNVGGQFALWLALTRDGLVVEAGRGVASNE
jgi:hypothetical protein